MCAPEVISKLAAVPMKAFSCAAAPFVWVLSKSTVFACNLLGVRNTTDRVTEEEIRLMIQENARDGDIQDVECIFNLGDRNLESIITSRGFPPARHPLKPFLKWISTEPPYCWKRWGKLFAPAARE